MSYPNGRPATIRVSEVDDSSGALVDIEIIDPGVGYTEEFPVELTIHSVEGAGAVLSAVSDSAGSITGITIVEGGRKYAVHDGISSSAPFRYTPGKEIALFATSSDPYAEIDSVVFSVNGVPLVDSNGSSALLNTTYTPMDLTPLFFTVNAENSSARIGDWTKGWLPSWLLQHHHQGGFLPIFYRNDVQLFLYR